MITLITRKEIIRTKKIISSELTKIQKSFYDEEALQYYKDNKEENLYWEQFDCLKNKEINHPIFTKIIGLNHSDINSFVEHLSAKLMVLFQTLKITELVVIAYLKLDFFGGRENNYKFLKKSYKKLEKIVGNQVYKEAFIIDMGSLSDFIEILFWTKRCDPNVAEYIFLFDMNEQIQLCLCKYGNLHVTEYNKEQLTEGVLKELGWTIIEGREFDNFSETGKIEGRRIRL